MHVHINAYTNRNELRYRQLRGVVTAGNIPNEMLTLVTMMPAQYLIFASDR